MPSVCARTNNRKSGSPNRKPSSGERSTRRLIEAGGLVDKAGLLDLDANALYGALFSLRDRAGEKKQVDQWRALGGRAFGVRRGSAMRARKQSC